MAFFADYIRYMKASRKFGDGSRQLKRSDFAAARSTFISALELLGPTEPSAILTGVWFSTRLVSLQGLARCAAKLDEVQLARSSIEEALQLWEANDIGPVSKFKGMPEWMAWAREYLEWSRGEATH